MSLLQKYFFVTYLLLIVLLAGLIRKADCSHILIMHTFASLSHRTSTHPLALELLKKGHNVTYISSVEAIHPNPAIKDIIPQQLKNYIEYLVSADFGVQNRIDGNMPFMPLDIPIYNYNSCELALTSPEVQEWLASSPKVDLIFADYTHECAVGLAHVLNAKVAIINTLSYWPRYSEILGSVDESSAIGSWIFPSFNGYKPKDSFISRVANALLPIGELLLNRFAYEPKYDTLFTENLMKPGDINFPDMRQLEERIDLILEMGNFINEHPRSLPPMVISAPGIHVAEKVNPLTKEIEDFVRSNSSQGFVYISLGTVARAPNLPKKIKDAFMDSIRGLPEVKFLWRWEGDFPQDIPDNLYLSQWFEQQDILGHPKCKGFITQVGRPSMQESIAHGVPMIGIPVLGDQDYNALRVEETGVAIKLELSHITLEKLTSSLHRILYDDKLRTRAAYHSKLFKDLPMKPLDTAVWWTEYILRHEDVSHLKPVGKTQTWYQRRQLDAWAFILLVICVILACIGFVCGLIYNKITECVFRRFNNMKVKTS